MKPLLAEVAKRTAVAIDLHMLGTHETGNETYARELTMALWRRANLDLKFFVTSRQALPPQLRDCQGVIEIGHRPAAIRLGFQYPRLTSKLRPDVLHMPTYIVPPLVNSSLVVTVLDLSYLVYPQLVEPRTRWMLKVLVGPSIRAASKVITISENSKRDIVRYYNVDPSKVVVTPLAAGPQFRPATREAIHDVRHKFDLARPYVLSVGNLLPRKNLPRLIEAFGRVSSSPELQLAIVGRFAWKGSVVQETVDKYGLSNRVRFLGYVPDEDLPALYSGAELFCFPSMYEGFGLPVIEAMACGVPTIVSDASSLPEVAGKAALTFRPDSVGEMAAAISEVIGNSELREWLRAAGLRRAAMFTWDRTAELTELAYQAAADQR